MRAENKEISIRTADCIVCRKCVQVCPAGILTQEKKDGAIGVEHTTSCILCGHCVDVCPTDSVLHSAFPQEKQHRIDQSMLPTPEQVMLLIKSRRSNRALSSTPVPQKILSQLVEAARYAPTASNSQSVSCTVITDPTLLLSISDYTIRVFHSVAQKLSNPIVKGILSPLLRDVYTYLPGFLRLKQNHDAGKDPILRKSTSLLIFHTPKSSRFGCEDCNLAYQNASLMAESLGVSQIYMGFVITAIRMGNKKKFAQLVGTNEKIHAIMGIGMPTFKYAKYTER